jgi:hypothetical protein
LVQRAGHAGGSAQINQICAPRSPTPGGKDLRQNGSGVRSHDIGYDGADRSRVVVWPDKAPCRSGGIPPAVKRCIRSGWSCKRARLRHARWPERETVGDWIVNEHHLGQVLTEYLQHYNTARPRRALRQLAPAQAHARPPEINLAVHQIPPETSPRRTHA